MEKNAQCKKCQNKFYQKDIYTIQQFQYRRVPSYEWTVRFFQKQNIGEWDSFCESCITYYQSLSKDEYEKAAKQH
ncbi:MAG: hypothetical protein QXN55_04180 [Candidatus Nitrosotenuis sp.]